MRGQIEIWTSDADAVDGFESIPRQAFDFAPSVVLRFEKRRLIDVSSEFQWYFDRQIRSLRAQLDPRRLSDFKHSDSALLTTSLTSKDELQRLQTTKIKILELVWSYLYSVRDQQAWNALATLWPSDDFGRIQQAVMNMRANGIRRELDCVSERLHSAQPVRRPPIYAYRFRTDPWEPLKVDTNPQPIYRRLPILPKDDLRSDFRGPIEFDLVIDDAGRVASAEAKDTTNRDVTDWPYAWRFIPAYKNGRPVACNYAITYTYYP
jgi:hypothetical protein